MDTLAILVMLIITWLVVLGVSLVLEAHSLKVTSRADAGRSSTRHLDCELLRCGRILFISAVRRPRGHLDVALLGCRRALLTLYGTSPGYA